jgi:hypothetical protein
MLRHANMFADTSAHFALASLDCARVSADISLGAQFFNAGVAALPSKWNGQLLANPNLSSGMIVVRENASIQLDQQDLSNSLGDAVLLKIGGVGEFGAVSGAGNKGVGIHVDRESYARIDTTGPGATTLTGVLGAMAFGHQTNPPPPTGYTTSDIRSYDEVRTADANGVKGYPPAGSPVSSYGNRIEP